MLDCVTVWIGNLFHHRGSDAALAEQAAVELASAVRQRSGPTFVVTNEVDPGWRHRPSSSHAVPAGRFGPRHGDGP
ncbi:MAG: bifunctional adenosylcobinamide kinase/adenosylcobinamide-phosphate guanylyltransferase [Acidimicrobiales bacterium]